MVLLPTTLQLLRCRLRQACPAPGRTGYYHVRSAPVKRDEKPMQTGFVRIGLLKGSLAQLFGLSVACAADKRLAVII